MPSITPLFPTNAIVATPGAMEALKYTGHDPCEFLDRHFTGDWGDLDAEDSAANDDAVLSMSRILSAYFIDDDHKIWIITDARGGPTTILLPSE